EGDHFPPCGIDKIKRFPKTVQYVSGKIVSGFRRQRNMNAQYIRFLPKLFKGNFFRKRSSKACFVLIVGQHPYVKTLKLFGKRGSHVSKAKNSHSLACQLLAPVLFTLPDLI